MRNVLQADLLKTYLTGCWMSLAWKHVTSDAKKICVDAFFNLTQLEKCLAWKKEFYQILFCVCLFLIIYFSLWIKNKPRDEITNKYIYS